MSQVAALPGLLCPRRSFRKASDLSCITPNKENATCQPWDTCKVILTALVNEESQALAFAEASICGDTSFVCCGSKGNFDLTLNNSDTYSNNQTITTLDNNEITTSSTMNNDTKRQQIKFALNNLLPSRRLCGLQHTDDYFYKGNKTALDEFPWLVYIPFEKSFIDLFDSPDSVVMRCTGSLISDRYVLTERLCGSRADPM
ncbi:hypothetical protein ILUMI_18669 [Ignelater luminosus]|uniref:Clip domain-containing protein n=1 Tax=Ignelater luminosus TaxID=2038154 RepID=A0A8K0G665_IGNLU|nr:hypothetical protein ILUMI_18669 [Ignelater luminosus]